MRNKISNIQGSSPYVVKVIFHYLGKFSGNKLFPLREVPILIRDVIDITCDFPGGGGGSEPPTPPPHPSGSALDVHNFFSVLATPHLRKPRVLNYVRNEVDLVPLACEDGYAIVELFKVSAYSNHIGMNWK